MPIFLNPTYNPASGYRPVVFIAGSPIAPGLGIFRKALATVTIDGVQIATLRADPLTTIGIFTLFSFDVQNIFQRTKAPNATGAVGASLCFGNINAQYNADAADCYGQLEISVEYFYTDTSPGPTLGLVVNQGLLDTSIAWPVFIATRQHEEAMSLDRYVPFLASLAPALWLTKQPTTFDIGLQENLFFNIIHGDANFLRVTTFDDANGGGAVIDDAFLVFPASGFNSQVALGVGPANLRSTTFTSGTINIDNPAVKSYRIVAGQGSAPFIGLTIAYFFNIDDCREGFFRLHWLNRLGGTDAYTFKSLNTRSQTTTSDTVQKTLAWDVTNLNPHSIEDKGTFKINSRANISRTLETQYIDAETADYLAELQSSPEVYLETIGGLLPIVIEPGSWQIETNTTQEVALVRFSITGPDSNERSIQRN